MQDGQSTQSGIAAVAVRGYEVIERVDAGTFGVIYRARQQGIDREVAVKVIKPEWADHPEFVRRFETEAQLVARLEHPHIVPLYDYWREPGGAYLAMRWVPGGSVADALQRGPFRPQAAAQLIGQIAGALDLAHRRGVVHRDLKPANVLLDRAGNAYLTDFGIAKDLESVESVTTDGAPGTPRYMAPEQIRAEAITPQTDVYALGMLAWVVLSGDEPWAGETLHAVLDNQLRQPLPELATVPAAVNTVIRKATAKEPTQRHRSAGDFAAELEQALEPGAAVAAATVIADNPYKGLRAFQEADAADFFGREDSIARLVDRMAGAFPEGRFLAVVGPSGSGKSSLVKAGLVPRLRSGVVPGSERWFFAEMTPGRHPLEELEAALLRVAVNPPASLLGQLREDARGLTRAVKRVLPDESAELLLVIDQFEEVFTLVESEETRRLMLDAIREAVTDERSQIRVVVTLRADFFDRPLSYAEFGDLLRRNLETIVPMTPGELERAIAGPAERVGVGFDPALTARIVAEVSDQPGALPLLQYALTELFDRRTGAVIAPDLYDAIGGVLGALGRRAEELYGGLAADRQSSARQLFLRLVTLGEGTEDTRRRALRSEVTGIGEGIDDVVDDYGRYRLLSFDHDQATREPTVEVAHEALLREWERYRGWIDESRDNLRTHSRLATAAAEWDAADREAGFLFRGPRLALYADWELRSGISLTETEDAFLAESRRIAEEEERAEQERLERELALEKRAAVRTRILLVVMTLAAVAGAVLTVFAVSNAREADAQARLSSSRELAAQAIAALETDPELSVLLAIEAADVMLDAGGTVPVEAEDALHRSLAALRVVFRNEAEFAAVAADGSLVASYGSGVVTIADPDGRERNTIDLPGASALDLSPDGTLLLVGQATGEVLTVNVASGTVVDRIQAHESRVHFVAFGRGSDLALTAADDGLLRIWDRTAGNARLCSTAATGADLASLAVDAGGSIGVRGTKFGGAEVFDVTAECAEFDDRTVGSGGAQAVAMTSDGIIVAGTENGTVLLAENGPGVPIGSHATLVTAVAVAVDSAAPIVATASLDNRIKTWDVATGRQLLEFDLGEPVLEMAAGGGLVIASGPSGTVAWNVSGAGAREGVAFTGNGAVTGVSISPDGTQVAIADGDVTLWSIDGAMLDRRHQEDPLVGDVAHGGGLLATSRPIAVWVWDEAGNRLLVDEVEGASGLETYVPGVALSPDGRQLAWSAGTGDLRLYDATTPNEGEALVGHDDDVGTVAFSRDGTLLASGDESGWVYLWDVATRTAVASWDTNSGVLDLAFLHDGATLVTAQRSGRAVLWDVPAALAGEAASISGFEGHSGPVTAVAVSPDGTLVATGGGDATVRLWEPGSQGDVTARPGTRDEIISLATQTAEVTALVFTPDGTRVIAASRDGAARTYHLDIEDLVALARERAPRAFTDEECQRFLEEACPTG